MLPVLGRLPDPVRRFALVQHTNAELSAKLPAEVSYTNLLGTRPDQSTYGCCVAEAATAIMQAESIKHHPGGWIAMSVAATYAQALRDTSPGQVVSDSGLPTGAGLACYQQRGYVPNEMRPFPPANDEAIMLAAVPPSEWVTTFRERTFAAVHPYVDAMRMALHARGMLQVGFEFPVAWFDGVGADGVLPPPTTDANGGHSWVICGYDDKAEVFIVANSWGTDWGVKPIGAKSRGFAYLPYSYASSAPQFWPSDLYCVSM